MWLGCWGKEIKVEFCCRSLWKIDGEMGPRGARVWNGTLKELAQENFICSDGKHKQETSFLVRQGGYCNTANSYKMTMIVVILDYVWNKADTVDSG